jgi:hypothetical protein
MTKRKEPGIKEGGNREGGGGHQGTSRGIKVEEGTVREEQGIKGGF